MSTNTEISMTPSPHPSERLLPEKVAAEHLALSVHTLRCWRSKNTGPRWIKLGGSVRYRLSDLDQFIQDSSSASRGGPHG